MRGWGDRVIEVSIKKLLIEIVWSILLRLALRDYGGQVALAYRRAGKAQSRMDD
jgi:hypothetical protein